MLLSLGSLLPLSSHFLTRLAPSPVPAYYQPVHIHVLDAHRPWNLENLFGGERERVWVWGDDGLMDDDEEGVAGKKRLGKEREAFEALEVRPRPPSSSSAGSCTDRLCLPSSQYEPDSDSDSDDSDDDLPSDESSSEEDVTDASGGSEDEDGERRPKRRRKMDESGNVGCF